MVSISKKFEFHAAHRLPTHKGKCRNIHGHTYLLEVIITGEVNDHNMIMDFGDLKHVVNDLIIEKLDHKYLNDLKDIDSAFPFPYENPTAEVMAQWIGWELQDYFDFGGFNIKVESIKLWETNNSYAIWSNDISD